MPVIDVAICSFTMVVILVDVILVDDFVGVEVFYLPVTDLQRAPWADNSRDIFRRDL